MKRFLAALLAALTVFTLTGCGKTENPAEPVTPGQAEEPATPTEPELTPEEIDEGYEKNTGKVIVETFKARGIDPLYVPGVLCASHGPFTWGKDAAQAVYHAAVLEEVAKMAYRCEHLNPEAKPAPQYLQDKHFFRKHGENAYYGNDL